jgi:hypothetical protein
MLRALTERAARALRARCFALDLIALDAPRGGPVACRGGPAPGAAPAREWLLCSCRALAPPGAAGQTREGALFWGAAAVRAVPPLPPVLTGHVSSLLPVLTGHVSSLLPVLTGHGDAAGQVRAAAAARGSGSDGGGGGDTGRGRAGAAGGGGRGGGAEARAEALLELLALPIPAVCVPPLPPLPTPSRTNWTRLVPPSVLTGHVSSLPVPRRNLHARPAARRPRWRSRPRCAFCKVRSLARRRGRAQRFRPARPGPGRPAPPAAAPQRRARLEKPAPPPRSRAGRGTGGGARWSFCAQTSSAEPFLRPRPRRACAQSRARRRPARHPARRCRSWTRCCALCCREAGAREVCVVVSCAVLVGVKRYDCALLGAVRWCSSLG